MGTLQFIARFCPVCTLVVMPAPQGLALFCSLCSSSSQPSSGSRSTAYRGTSRFAGTEVVEDVLKELPLDLQQEVANDLARRNALATLRPTHQSSFVQFPASEPEPQRWDSRNQASNLMPCSQSGGMAQARW